MAIPFNDIADIVTAGGTLLNLFTKRNQAKEVPAIDEMINATRSGQEYIKASTDVNHPYFKNLKAINAERNLAERAGWLVELLTADRRARARGNPGVLINSERRDEAVASAYLREGARQDMMDNEKIRNWLASTGQGYLQSIQGLTQPAQYQSAYADMNANRQSAIPGGIAELIRGAGQIYDRWNQPTTQPTWNPWGQSNSRAINYRG